MSVDLVKELRERAGYARRESTMTAEVDARYFEQAADHIEAIRAENERYKAALTKIAGGMDVTLHTGEVVTMVRDDVEAIARAVLSGGQP